MDLSLGALALLALLGALLVAATSLAAVSIALAAVGTRPLEDVALQKSAFLLHVSRLVRPHVALSIFLAHRLSTHVTSLGSPRPMRSFGALGIMSLAITALNVEIVLTALELT